MKNADCFDVSVNGVAVRKLFAELKENYMVNMRLQKFKQWLIEKYGERSIS